MRSAGSQRHSVRIRGGRTKLSWGRPAWPERRDPPAWPERRDPPTEPPGIELSTERLDRIVEHNEGDLTAVVQAGMPLARVQEALAEADQMVSLDPPLGDDDGATIGGVVATADSGPMRHRYGAARDVLLGITVVLSDGTIAKAGGKVIKNVAGYDLAKLFTGSFGTLGLIVEVVVRLHPRPPENMTVVGRSADPAALGQAALAVAHSPFGPECLDVWWTSGNGDVLARFGGAAPEAAAKEVAKLMEHTGLETRLVEEDDALWDRQRAGQRSADGTVVRVSGLAAELPRVVRAADRVGASLVGRAGLGLSWLTLAGADSSEVVPGIEDVRRRLHPFPCVVLDAPAAVREEVDVWGEAQAVSLMRRVKARFDPQGICNPGIFVGGI
ncbi:MAG: FAD-binding oxidoreductase [Acidimicrobiales bacterium]